MLRDHWIAHLPSVDFDSKYPEPILWHLSGLPHLQSGDFDTSGRAEYPYVDGTREAIFREALLLARKFIYCGMLMPILADKGRNTWTAVTAYESAFYGAKSFCYLLGFASLGRDSKIYLDAFDERVQTVGRQRTKVYDTLRLYKLPERLTHKMLWGLTQRLIDTTKFEGDLQRVQIDLRKTDWNEFVGFRNKIFYDGGFWPMHADMNLCDLVQASYIDKMVRAAWFEPDSRAPFAEDYFVVGRLLRELIRGMFQTIAEIAPSLAIQVSAFAALQRAQS